jgi:hypothetical protein
MPSRRIPPPSIETKTRPAPPLGHVAVSDFGVAAATADRNLVGQPAGDREESIKATKSGVATPRTSTSNAQADLWELLEPVVRAERARQTSPIKRYQSSATVRIASAGTNSPDKRILTTHEAAKYFKVSVKTFMIDHAPHLHPILSSKSATKRRHRRWDLHEIDRYIDGLTGGRKTQEPSREDLAFVTAQMEKRLE